VLDGQETADPSYANDRTQIAYWCHGVCVVHPDGSGRRVLSADNGVLPSWAGDDSHLAYVNQRDNRGTVTIITPSSAAPVASTGPGTSAIEVRPAWAADGSAVAFAAGPAPATGPVGSTDIYTLTVAGVTTRVTTARDSGASDRPLGWTNDHRIVFNRHGADDHPIGYYVVDAAAGATPTRVSDAGGDGALSPDGRRLAVATATGLTVVELATGSATTLAVKSPAVVLWSPNGRALAGTNPDGLYRVAADGSTNPTYYIGESSLPRWGPDSDRIAFRGRRTQEAVWELNVVGPNMTSSLVVGSVGQGACCLGRYTW
jgi:Tol biopolymer transport system component